MAKSFYVIDGHAQIFRAYYAPFRNLTSPDGEPTRATYVFCSMLFKLIQQRRPDYLAMAIDVPDSTAFRRGIFPDYKIQREPPPEDLLPQVDRIVEIVRSMGIPVLSMNGFEADDVLATLAARHSGNDLHVYLVSKDKDLEQLISDHVFLFDPAKDRIIDRDYLMSEKGYSPEQVVDVQTLSGDTVDNIPGVKGIGQKTAAKLIARYGSAEEVLNNAHELTPKQSENVLAFRQQMPITRELVTLRRDVEVDFNLAEAEYAGIDADAVDPLFDMLGFHRLREQLQELSNAGSLAAVIEEKPRERTEQVEYTLVDTEDKLRRLSDQLAGVRCLAVDTETTGLNPVTAKLVGISLSWKGGAAYYIPVRALSGDVISIGLLEEYLKPILENADIGKVGQNIKYDIVVLRQVGIELKGVEFDTMVASFVLDSTRRSHGIDHLAEEFLGHKMIPITDLIGKGKNQVTMDEVPVSHVCEYACEDADITWQLAEIMRPRMENSSTAELFQKTEVPLITVLAELEHNGVAVDTSVLTRMSHELADRLSALVAEIHREAGHSVQRRFNQTTCQCPLRRTGPSCC